jgi:hypothetical protein
VGIMREFVVRESRSSGKRKGSTGAQATFYRFFMLFFVSHDDLSL